LQEPTFSAARQQIESILTDARKKAEKDLLNKLGKALSNNLVKRTQKLCARGTEQLPADLSSSVDKQLRTIAREAKLDDAEGLHEVRIQLKKIRYALESQDNEALKPTIDSLKVVHDAIGEWHDWTTLADIAAEHLPRRSPFVVQARRKTASLFVNAIEETERFFALYQALRKRPASATIRTHSARAHA
jgi:CHAD domain-containing protein